MKIVVFRDGEWTDDFPGGELGEVTSIEEGLSLCSELAGPNCYPGCRWGVMDDEGDVTLYHP